MLAMKALIELLEEYIAFVHKVEGICFNRYHRHYFGVMHKSVSHDDVRRNAPSKIYQRMHLDCTFAMMELCLWR